MDGEKVNGTGNPGEVRHNDRGEDVMGEVKLFLSLYIFPPISIYITPSFNLICSLTFNPSLPWFPPGIFSPQNLLHILFKEHLHRLMC